MPCLNRCDEGHMRFGACPPMTEFSMRNQGGKIGAFCRRTAPEAVYTATMRSRLGSSATAEAGSPACPVVSLATRLRRSHGCEAMEECAAGDRRSLGESEHASAGVTEETTWSKAVESWSSTVFFQKIGDWIRIQRSLGSFGCLPEGSGDVFKCPR